MVYYNIVFMWRSFRYPGAGVGGWASEGGWCGGYFWFGSTLRSNFLLLENCWRSPSFQYPYDPRIKEQDKSFIFFDFVQNTTTTTMVYQNNTSTPPTCVPKQHCVVHILVMLFWWHFQIIQTFPKFFTSFGLKSHLSKYSRHTPATFKMDNWDDGHIQPTIFDHKVNFFFHLFANLLYVEVRIVSIPTWLAKTGSFGFVNLQCVQLQWKGESIDC